MSPKKLMNMGGPSHNSAEKLKSRPQSVREQSPTSKSLKESPARSSPAKSGGGGVWDRLWEFNLDYETGKR